MSYKKGDTATMIFSVGGMSSEEDFKVIEVKENIIMLDTDEDENKCYKFNTKNGKCINDNTSMGASRRLKI